MKVYIISYCSKNSITRFIRPQESLTQINYNLKSCKIITVIHLLKRHL